MYDKGGKKLLSNDLNDKKQPNREDTVATLFKRKWKHNMTQWNLKEFPV